MRERVSLRSMRRTSASESYSRDQASRFRHPLSNPGTKDFQHRRVREQKTVKASVHIGLSGTAVTDAGLQNLITQTGMYTLELEKTNVTDVGLGYIQGMTSLMNLHLREAQITDAGLQNLRTMKSLLTLDLAGTDVTDAGLQNLMGIRSLSSLQLNRTSVTDEGGQSIESRPSELCNSHW